MVTIDVQDTPNPRAKRFVLDQPVQADLIGRAFTTGDDVDDTLVAAVLAVPAAASVLTLPSSITVTVATAEDWTGVVEQVSDAIQQHFA